MRENQFNKSKKHLIECQFMKLELKYVLSYTFKGSFEQFFHFMHKKIGSILVNSHKHKITTNYAL